MLSMAQSFFKIFKTYSANTKTHKFASAYLLWAIYYEGGYYSILFEHEIWTYFRLNFAWCKDENFRHFCCTNLHYYSYFHPNLEHFCPFLPVLWQLLRKFILMPDVPVESKNTQAKLYQWNSLKKGCAMYV